jgi:branched-chain amino acid transport system ATP-binding protein
MNALLATDSLSLRFGGITALNDVSLAVSAGEMLAIVGPNGAGKTSLLNCVTGAYHATSGRITFNGEDITRAAAHTATQRGIARTFQHNELFPQMTVVENLLLGRQADLAYSLFAAAVYWGRCQRWELEERENIEEIIEFFELEPYRKRLIADLPYGIQKLVGLARAFATRPKLLLLDEPSAGLNRQEKEDLARYILRARHELAPTIVWIEHDMQLVRDLADRVFVLHYGSKLASGPTEQVLADPKVIEAYIGKHKGVHTSDR